MPFKRKRSYRKRPIRRRRRRARTNISVQKSPGFSSGQIVRLRYHQQITLDPDLGVAKSYIFWANGLYDPDYTSTVTGTGHQPLGYDQWSTFYDHHIVLGSKCSATFQSTGSTATGNTYVVGVLLGDNNISLNGVGVSKLIEQGRSRYKTLGVDTSGSNTKTVVKKFSAKKFFSCKDVQDRTDIAGGVSTDPEEGAFYHIWAAPSNNANDPGVLYVNVLIEYIVLFKEPRLIAQS